MSKLKKILIVDDNGISRRILSELLSGDYRLKFAKNGTDAIAVASTFQPALVLLDVMLPGLDGLDVCRRLRQLPGVSSAAIIMMSAKAMQSEQAAGIDAGANAYLTKPFDEVELIDLLRSHLRSSSEADLHDAVDLREGKGLAAY